MINDDILNKIDEELFQDNISTEINEETITWIDNFGAENKVYKWMTTSNENLFAWWQCNEVGKEVVRIKLENNVIINWRPPINTMGTESLGCSFIKFFLNYLIVIYADKHTNRIFTINTKNIIVEEVNFYGYYKKIKLVDNELFVTKSSSDEILKLTIFPNRVNNEIVDAAYLKIKKISFD